MNKSVYFITFHKTASSFFSAYVLGKINNLTQVDYLGMIYNNRNIDEIRFEQYGHVYGVFRLTIDEASRGYKRIVSTIIGKDFLNDKKVIFFIRDPRAILVSYYYSMGFTHNISANKEIARLQLERRNIISQMTVDGFVLRNAEWLRSKFILLDSLMSNTKDHILLKYEDMILNYDKFYNDLSRFVELKAEVQEIMFRETRPNNKEQLSEHKRSGVVDSYRAKLKHETIATLNASMKDILDKFGYS